MRGWQKLLMRSSGRLLLCRGGLSWGIDQHGCLHPITCHRSPTNEERQPQHFCDFHGTLTAIATLRQVLWHGTREQGHSLTYTRANP